MHDFNINDFQWLEYYPAVMSHTPETTINTDNIVFSTSVLKKLGLPPFIKLLFDSKGKRIAVQGFTKKGSGTIHLSPERKCKRFSIAKMEKVRFIRNLMPEWDERTCYKVAGDYHENENVMVFDLKTGVVFRSGRFSETKPNLR